MWERWIRRTFLFLCAVVGGLLLAASLSLIQPNVLADVANSSHHEANAQFNEGSIGAQAAPTLEILAPSEASRPDFARDVLGDAWDMQNANDVDYMDHVSNSIFDSSGWYGRVQQGAVANIALFAPGGPGNPPSVQSIDGSKYYYFSYDLYIPRTTPPDQPGDQTNHRIVYLTQWSWYGFIPGSQHCSGALTYTVGYNAWYTYHFDLRNVPRDSSACGSWNWAGDTVKALLVWPHEQWNDVHSGRGPQYFRYRNISLKGDNQANTSYDIRWCVADSDGDAITTTLYYDTDTTWGGGVKIDSVVTQPAPSPGPHRIYLPIISKQGGTSNLTCSAAGAKQVTYPWDTSARPDGARYFIWFEVTDGSTTIRQVSTSTAPITIDH